MLSRNNRTSFSAHSQASFSRARRAAHGKPRLQHSRPFYITSAYLPFDPRNPDFHDRGEVRVGATGRRLADHLKCFSLHRCFSILCFRLSISKTDLERTLGTNTRTTDHPECLYRITADLPKVSELKRCDEPWLSNALGSSSSDIDEDSICNEASHQNMRNLLLLPLRYKSVGHRWHFFLGVHRIG